LTTHRGIYYLHVEQFLALYALMGFLDLLGLLGCFLPLFRILWFGMEDYRLAVYHEAGSIPEELLLGFFLFSFLVVWLHSLVFNKPFCSLQKLNDHTHLIFSFLFSGLLAPILGGY
jgi:hypothetical protein